MPCFANPAEETAKVRECVNRYLYALEGCDYAALRNCWDAKSQNLVTTNQLRTAFIHPLTPDDDLSMYLSPASIEPRDLERLIVGRPEHHSMGAVHLLSPTEATVDCRAVFDMELEFGLNYDFVTSEFCDSVLEMEQAIFCQRKKDAGEPLPTKRQMIPTPIADAVRKDLVLYIEKDSPSTTFDTAQGHAKEIGELNTLYGYQHAPPYVTLHFRRFTLTKERGAWKITNAVSVSQKPLMPVQTNNLIADEDYAMGHLYLHKVLYTLKKEKNGWTITSDLSVRPEQLKIAPLKPERKVQ